MFSKNTFKMSKMHITNKHSLKMNVNLTPKISKATLKYIEIGKLYQDLFPKSKNEAYLWINSLTFCGTCF